MPRFPSSAVLTALSILEFLGASRELGAIGLARHVPQARDDPGRGSGGATPRKKIPIIPIT